MFNLGGTNRYCARLLVSLVFVVTNTKAEDVTAKNIQSQASETTLETNIIAQTSEATLETEMSKEQDPMNLGRSFNRPIYALASYAARVKPRMWVLKCTKGHGCVLVPIY